MKSHLEFELAWQGLREGAHVYDYTVNQAFMEERGAPTEYRDWSATVCLTFNKHPDFFQCRFEVGGSVMVPCDRCGDDFSLALWDEFKLLMQLTDEEPEHAPAEDETDIEYIPRTRTVLDIAPYLYEFVMLSVPVQRVHPSNPDGTSGCNPEALKLLSGTVDAEDYNKEADAEDAPKAIWKGLEALQQKANNNDNNLN